MHGYILYVIHWVEYFERYLFKKEHSSPDYLIRYCYIHNHDKAVHRKSTIKVDD